MYTIKGYFTDRDEQKVNEYGFTDDDHWQYDSEKSFTILDDACRSLMDLVMDVAKEELQEHWVFNGRIEVLEDGKVIAIFYSDGDISTFKVIES